MNILSRDKQIQIIAALVDGLGVRATARVTDTDRKTVARLALRIGHGCAELHDRMMVGLRVSRLGLDELWTFVGKNRSAHARTNSPRATNPPSSAWPRPAGRSSRTAPVSAAPTPRTNSSKTYASG